MQGVIPVFADDALDHLVIVRVVWVRIGSVTIAIQSRVVLVVLVPEIVLGLLIQCALLAVHLGSATVAGKVALRVQLDQFVVLVTGIAAGQTNADTLLAVVLGLGDTRQARVQGLAFDGALDVRAVLLVGATKDLEESSGDREMLGMVNCHNKG